MIWQHQYSPAGIGLSAAIAALPIAVLLLLLGILRKPAWLSALCGLLTAAAVAIFFYGMPVSLAASSVAYGASFGLFPIGWVVFSAILLFNLTIETGQFEILKRSLGALTTDRRMQALMIAFAFGAFLEGAAGFGAPVAIAASMLVALGFEPFYAAGICLLANTAPVAFGSIGIPLTTLATVTGLPLARLSQDVGRICAPVSCILPAYLIVVMSGWRGLRGVLGAALACGGAFGFTQFFVSNFIGPEITDILSSLAAILALVIMERLSGRKRTPSEIAPHALWKAWSPYLLLVVFVLFWGFKPMQLQLARLSLAFPWPGLHNLIQRMPPASAKPALYPAIYTFNWLSASGTACLFAAICSALILRVSPSGFTRVFTKTVRQLWLAEATIAMVLALAFLMNYSGTTATLGLAFAATGPAFPFFSALLGWLGVFLTGSDTSANALFGNLQAVTANKLGMDPILMAAANSSGGVMGKMISLTSIAVAAAATGMKPGEDSKLFRFTLRHSITLAVVIGLITLLYSRIL
jgi:L-lactate transport